MGLFALRFRKGYDRARRLFEPSFLTIATARPLWGRLREVPRAGAVVAALGASVVGLLAAVSLASIAPSLVREPPTIGLAAVAFFVLARIDVAPWAVVRACALGGAGIAALAP